MSLWMAVALHTGEEGHRHPAGSHSRWIRAKGGTMNPRDLFCFRSSASKVSGLRGPWPPFVPSFSSHPPAPQNRTKAN